MKGWNEKPHATQYRNGTMKTTLRLARTSWLTRDRRWTNMGSIAFILDSGSWGVDLRNAGKNLTFQRSLSSTPSLP